MKWNSVANPFVPINLIAFLTMVGGLLAAVMYGKLSRRKSRIELAQDQFLQLERHSENSKFSFSPQTATIVRQDIDTTNGESTTYALTQYARNESGEYFVLRSDGVTPTLKHLDHGIAKVVLKNAYIAQHESA